MPMSTLFWWSATRSSIFLPSTAPPKSSIAIRTACTELGPGEIGVGAGLIVHDAEDEGRVVGDRRGGEGEESEGET